MSSLLSVVHTCTGGEQKIEVCRSMNVWSDHRLWSDYQNGMSRDLNRGVQN